MNLIVEKSTRSLRQRILSSRVVYEARRTRASSDSEMLPSLDEATRVISSMRPPLRESTPCLDLSWPEDPRFDISVIVPCYNAEKFARSSLLSALEQDCEASFEVVAVNDGSTDGTRDVIARLESDYLNLRVVDQENAGFSGARNAGIRAMKGGAVCFLDADDVLMPHALQAMWEALRDSHADYVTARYVYIDERGRKLPLGPQSPHGVAWGRLFDRRMWQGVSFPEDMWLEDMLHAYLIAPCFLEHRVDDVVYAHRKQSGSITVTSRRSKRAVDTFYVVECLLRWRQDLNMPLTQDLYEQTLKQMGSLLLSRTGALTDYESRCLFVMACDLLEKTGELFENRKDGTISTMQCVRGITRCGDLRRSRSKRFLSSGYRDLWEAGDALCLTF